MNDYPPGLLKQHIHRRYCTITAHRDSHKNDDILIDDNSRGKKYVSIPYVAGLFESLNRIFAKHNIRFVGNNNRDLSFVFDSGKDVLPMDKRSNAIYKIPCNDCNGVYYIGQTYRQINTRVKEHKNNINELVDRHTALTMHMIEYDHSFNYDGTVILDQEPRKYRRLLLEMCNIVGHSTAVNLRQDVEHLSFIYSSAVKKY